jgi:glycerate 2-kinase
MTDPKVALRKIFDAAVVAAAPDLCIPAHMPEKPRGRTIVIGAGKASAAMAAAFERNWRHPLEGLVITRYGYAVPCSRIRIVEASHPVPDARGREAAEQVLKLVRGLTKDDLVVALMSGGGSALLSLPPEGVSDDDKRALNRALLASGAPIQEMNCVRKHVSRIKGGRLAAAAHPARVLTLAISDIPGDDLSAVASGPTMPDSTTYADARAIVARYAMTLPESIKRHLDQAADETPKPGDARLANAQAVCIASPQQSLEAAAAKAKELGFTPLILGDAIEGEARDVGTVLAGVAKQVVRFGQPIQKPCAIISGGETTVTIRGKGVGGRNVECLLAMALKLHGAAGVYALAGDSDGVDGAAEVAGAMITPDTLDRARLLGINAADCVTNNDAHTFFEKLGDQVITGPTLTNVNDIRIILVTS